MKRTLAILLAFVLMFSAVPAFASESTDKDTVKKVQKALNEAGYDCGMPDGIAGKNTQQAISRYRADKGLEGTGAIDDELLDALGVSEKPMEAGEESPIAPEGDEQGRELLDSIPMGGGSRAALTNPHPQIQKSGMKSSLMNRTVEKKAALLPLIFHLVRKNSPDFSLRERMPVKKAFIWYWMS
jgi:hypothetical protein